MVDQPIFSIVPLILTFDFDLILGLFFTFGALMGYFWDQIGLKNNGLIIVLLAVERTYVC